MTRAWTRVLHAAVVRFVRILAIRNRFEYAARQTFDTCADMSSRLSSKTRLDYCNSLLYNTANKDIAKLQRVQNCLARVVTRSPRFSRSVPLLKSLHWLPVHYRIIFKMCTIAYQALSSTQPAYLNSMLTPTRISRQLRSTSSNPLHIPRVKTKAGTRAFSVAAPTVWNSLPASVKSQGNIVSFRRHLKTYLFNAAYPP